MGPVLGGTACVPVNSTAEGMDFETGFTIRGDFGSLSKFIKEECSEGAVLSNLAPTYVPSPQSAPHCCHTTRPLQT